MIVGGLNHGSWHMRSIAARETQSCPHRQQTRPPITLHFSRSLHPPGLCGSESIYQKSDLVYRRYRPPPHSVHRHTSPLAVATFRIHHGEGRREEAHYCREGQGQGSERRRAERQGCKARGRGEEGRCCDHRRYVLPAGMPQHMMYTDGKLQRSSARRINNSKMTSTCSLSGYW